MNVYILPLNTYHGSDVSVGKNYSLLARWPSARYAAWRRHNIINKKGPNLCQSLNQDYTLLS